MRIFKLTVREACTQQKRGSLAPTKWKFVTLYHFTPSPNKLTLAALQMLKKDFANSLFQIFCILLLCPCPPRSCPPVKRIMFCTSQLRFSTMHCFEFLCNVYVENLTERQHFGNIFPKGRQILGQFIFTFFGLSESEVTVPWTVNSPQKPRHPLSSRRAMRHWHLNCEVIRKHNPPLSEKNRKRIHAWQLFSTLKSLTPQIFVECQLFKILMLQISGGLYLRGNHCQAKNVKCQPETVCKAENIRLRNNQGDWRTACNWHWLAHSSTHWPKLFHVVVQTRPSHRCQKLSRSFSSAAC